MKPSFARRTLLCAALGLLAATVSAAEPPRKTITLCGQTLTLRAGDEVRALGFPWVDVSDEENAATYYIRGANALQALTAPDKWYEQFEQALDHGWDDAKMKELGAYLGAARPALDHYRKGSALKLCQLPFSKTEMLAGMLLPGLARVRLACRLLAAEARRFEAKKEFTKVADNWLTIVRIGNHHGRGRTLIDQLVGIACISVGTQNAFKGLCLQRYPEAELKRLVEELGRLRADLPDFAHAMRCEKAFGLGSVDDIMRLGPSTFASLGADEGAGPKLSPLQLRLFRILFPDRTIKADMARFYDRHITDAKKPFHLVSPRDDDEALAACKPWNVFAGLLLPALSRARAQAEKCRVSLDLLQIAAALKLYERQNGVYPDELGWLKADGILKDLPADPFSGKPYLYKTTDGGFTLYSVGPDKEDNGGKLEGPVDFDNAGDIGFTSRRTDK